MDRCGGVLVLQSETDELTLVLTLVLYAIDEVGAALNHTLVDQFLEGLVLAGVAGVVEELVPETRVNQVACGVLRTTYVEVYVAPVLVSVVAHEGLLVLGVHIAQIVCTGASETRHRVQLQWEDALVVDEVFADHLVRLGVPGPHLGASQWGLARLRRLVLVNLRQLQGQALLGNHVGHIVLVVDGERLAPVALT